MKQQSYPILEFDPDRSAIIEPSFFITPTDVSKHCVICYYRNVVQKVADETGARVIYEDHGVYGTNPFFEFDYHGQPIVCFNPLVGASVGAAFLELAIAFGCQKFISCGSAGVLDHSIAPGDFIITSGAVRDEGASYHYLPPGREIDVAPHIIDALKSTLKEAGESYSVGKTWTTDGIFRETRSRIQVRKEEGCLTVEMEAAALLAVAEFRKVTLGYLLCGGDDVSGQEWDRRHGMSPVPISERLFWLSVDACLKL